MATGDTIRLDHQDLAAVLNEASTPPRPTLGAPLGFDATMSLDDDAASYGKLAADIPMMIEGRAFDPFQAHPPKDDPEVSAAFKRLDLVESRLARIEKRLMEISVLIARNFNATLATPLGVPDVLEQAAEANAQSAEPSAVQSSTAPVPRQTRGRRDRDLDDALEAFLNSLGPTQTRQ